MTKKKIPYKNSSLKSVMDCVEDKLNGDVEYCHPTEILKRSINCHPNDSKDQGIEKIWNEAEALSLKVQSQDRDKLASGSMEQWHPEKSSSSEGDYYRAPNDLYMTRYWDRDSDPLEKPKL